MDPELSKEALQSGGPAGRRLLRCPLCDAALRAKPGLTGLAEHFASCPATQEKRKLS